MVAKCLPLLFFEGWCVQGAAPVAACGVKVCHIHNELRQCRNRDAKQSNWDRSADRMLSKIDHCLFVQKEGITAKLADTNAFLALSHVSCLTKST
jgi:hypothetical protein